MQENMDQPKLPPDELITRIGQVTRSLRASIRELGLERAVQDAADAIPDARDRLRYVATMTEQAATKVLNATEVAQPLQDSLHAQALALSAQWEARSVPNDELVVQTQTFLGVVAEQSKMTSTLLMDIMMAQGFQDLTGQVILKMITLVGNIEKELLQVLVDHLPPGLPPKKEDEGTLLNGPQIKADQPDVVSDQSQVDDLLASLGL